MFTEASASFASIQLRHRQWWSQSLKRLTSGRWWMILRKIQYCAAVLGGSLLTKLQLTIRGRKGKICKLSICLPSPLLIEANVITEKIFCVPNSAAGFAHLVWARVPRALEQERNAQAEQLTLKRHKSCLQQQTDHRLQEIGDSDLVFDRLYYSSSTICPTVGWMWANRRSRAIPCRNSVWPKIVVDAVPLDKAGRARALWWPEKRFAVGQHMPLFVRRDGALSKELWPRPWGKVSSLGRGDILRESTIAFRLGWLVTILLGCRVLFVVCGCRRNSMLWNEFRKSVFYKRLNGTVKFLLGIKQ